MEIDLVTWCATKRLGEHTTFTTVTSVVNHYAPSPKGIFGNGVLFFTSFLLSSFLPLLLFSFLLDHCAPSWKAFSNAFSFFSLSSFCFSHSFFYCIPWPPMTPHQQCHLAPPLSLSRSPTWMKQHIVEGRWLGFACYGCGCRRGRKQDCWKKWLWWSSVLIMTIEKM